MDVDFICIGGTGGSGTRTLAKLSRKLDFVMGSKVNVTLDSMRIVKGCLNKWIPIYLSKVFSDNEEKEMTKDFIRSVELQFDGEPVGKRVIKNPRSIYLMPKLHQLYSNFKYLHLVRDGRSIAFNTRPNKKYTEQYASLIFDDIKFGVWSPEIAIRVWSKINSKIFEYGQGMGDNYLCIKYEDLCSNNTQAYLKLSRFLDTPYDTVVKHSKFIIARKDIYKWKGKSNKLIEKLEVAGYEGLKNFGYIR